ncbi:SGNH/GDSL hydrolase family protein [Ramlibacter pallidus]|uniref:SGNH/GDSL hydrolase family protein n=1 Tax=Ramlibacter pallidus TaxID=2780087 RepID=A0ABR9S1I4_9BURK|nr:SGNH/GDSL hydrolase family protein [Ramlibacter pallidus]MBE7367358.1 SGNH/GDSL hydrolase family protein [Ramlibacter pallidus]
MASQWLRRGWLVAGASALLLAACGGGSVESEFTPSRIVAFGDAMADLGQNGSRYTVNDGSVNNWTQFVADSYGRPLAASSAGGYSYATGNARVVAEPDAGGLTSTPTVKEQIDTFLATATPTALDLVIVNAGTSDLIVQAEAARSGAQTRDQMIAAVELAARELAAQVRRLVNAGATHVVVVPPINLGRTPWAVETGESTLFETATREFNTELLVRLEDLGDKLLYVDAEREFNVYYSNAAGYDLGVVTVPACTSIDSGDPDTGIGTGGGQVDSSECGAGDVRESTYNRYLFADRVYPTPHAHRLFGDFAQARIKERW